MVFVYVVIDLLLVFSCWFFMVVTALFGLNSLELSMLRPLSDLDAYFREKEELQKSVNKIAKVGIIIFFAMVCLFLIRYYFLRDMALFTLKVETSC